jgi:hypothetical protein
MRVVISTVLVALAVASVASAELSRQPAVAVVDRAPVTIRGTGFGTRERVLVTVTSGILRAMQRTRATYRGSFVVSFDALRLPCAGGTVVATGARGHVARVKLALRECPGPAIDP